MHRILITAFAPFLEWPNNASEQILSQWCHDNPQTEAGKTVTEVLPVDYALAEPRVRELVAGEAAGEIDFAIHLGQSAHVDRFALEVVALNLKYDSQTPVAPLNPVGSPAHVSNLPLEEWALELNRHEIPAKISLHAGTYLCNAAYYWSTEAFLERDLANRSVFVHVPRLEALANDDTQALALGSRMLTRLMRLVQNHLSGNHFGSA